MMQWIPGDKCILNEAVFSRFIKSVGPTVCRKREVYVVADIDPYQAVVLIVGKNGPTPVLATWILPVEERDWRGCRRLVGKSLGPTELVRNLHRPEPATSPGDEPDSIPDERASAAKPIIARALVQVGVVLIALLSPMAALIALLLLRTWGRGNPPAGF